MSLKRSLLWIMIIWLIPVDAFAETAEEKGLKIAETADRTDQGWGDSTSKQKMILINRHGEKRERQMRSMALEVPEDGDKRLIVFDYPPDMRGTGLLNFSHKVEDDDQWLYLPKLKRVRRIASRSKSTSFLGSEFAYEDIAGQEIEKFHYRWLRDEPLNERPCFVVESVPVDKRNSGYSRRVSWIDQERYVVWKIDYYDRKNSFYKTLTFSDYQLYRDHYWRAGQMEMINHQNENRTLLIWDSYRFNTGLNASDFSQRRLKQGR